MINETSLRDTLVSVFEHLKKQYSLISAAQMEISALCETFREMDGELFSSTLKRHRASFLAAQSGDPSCQEFDAIIQKLKDAKAL